MDPAIAGLVILSAIIHPLRDLTLKGNGYPESTYLGVTAAWIGIAAGQILAEGGSFHLPAEVWVNAGLSSLGLLAYYGGTMAALKRGDMSIYYPIIRSSPLFIILVSIAFLDQSYSAIVIGGIALAMAGVFFLQRGPSGRLLSHPSAFGFAVLAMVGSGTYAISDAFAVQHVSPATFLFYVYSLLTLAFTLLFLLTKPKRRNALSHLFGGWTRSPWRVLFAATTSYVSYLLILIAYEGGGEPAVVNAVRQLSVPVSVLMSAWVLKESRIPARFAWSLVLGLGIAAIVIHG